MSVDGLVSGLQTSDMISQLMKIEAIPQQALKNRVSAQNKAVSAFQSLNTRLSSLTTAARALGSADSWGAMRATSTSDAAVASVKPGSAPGSVSFRVANLAATHLVTYSAGSVASASDAAGSPVLSGAKFEITLADGVTKKELTPADRSLQAVVKAINDEADAPYKAAAVQIAPGRFTLQLSAKNSGTAAAFVPPDGIDLLGAAQITTQGDDARLTVGSTNPYTIISATNTFTDVLPGVTVTASRAQAPTDPPITVSVAQDVNGIADRVKALVDNANVVLSEIASQSRPKSGEVAAGPLAGDTALRKLAQDILGAVSGGADGLGSLSAVGVGLDRSGRLTFDRQKFVDAYQADPAGTQAHFDSYADRPHDKATAGKFEPGWDTAKGIARKLEAISVVAGEGAVLPTDPAGKAKQGLLQELIERRNAAIRGLNDQVSNWDIRLERRKAGLQRQFGGLEVALGKLRSQSTWLAGQISTMPTNQR